jgi:hypothetical protein
MSGITRRLAEAAPAAEVRVIDVPPVAGAALLGLDHVRAPAAAATPAGDDALQTNTLAELYLKQGFVERAMDVYRAMLRVDATNERARRRLVELEGAVAAGESPAARPAATAAPDEATASAAAFPDDAAAEADSERLRATVARLESWRNRIVAGRSGGMRGAGR